MASSVLMVQVETKLDNTDQGTPIDRTNSKNTRSSNSSGGIIGSSDVDKSIDRALRRHQGIRNQFIEPQHSSNRGRTTTSTSQDETKATTSRAGTTSLSDPSSMCMVVKDYLHVLSLDASKENIQYDVLKKHRDYHLMKVWKHIDTLEKLNM